MTNLTDAAQRVASDIETASSRTTDAQPYRKKPVVIMAVKFTERMAMAHLFDGAPLPDGLICGSSHIHKERRELYRASFYIETLEGRMRAEYDDWIITGVKGERYPCKPDIFAATYEPARTLCGPSEPESRDG